MPRKVDHLFLVSDERLAMDGAAAVIIPNLRHAASIALIDILLSGKVFNAS